MLDDGLSFQLVPWQPVLEKRTGQHISGVVRDSGGIEWGSDDSPDWDCEGAAPRGNIRLHSR